MTPPTNVLHQPERYGFGQPLSRLDVGIIFVVGEFLTLGTQPRGDPLHRGAARPVGIEHLPEKRPGRQQGSVDDVLPGGPFLLENLCQFIGGKNLVQTEIEIGLLGLIEAKDLVP